MESLEAVDVGLPLESDGMPPELELGVPGAPPDGIDDPDGELEPDGSLVDDGAPGEPDDGLPWLLDGDDGVDWPPDGIEGMDGIWAPDGDGMLGVDGDCCPDEEHPLIMPASATAPHAISSCR